MQPFLELGGVGGVCVHTHVVGPQVAEQVQAARDGDLERARRDRRRARPAYELLKVQTNPIAIKAALNLLGHRGRRPPPAARRRRRDARSAASAAASSGSACSCTPEHALPGPRLRRDG